MKANLLKSFFAISLLVISTHSKAMEQIVATVDGIPVLESQVKQVLDGKANNKANRTEALNSIIDDILVQKTIQESQIQIHPAQIEQAIDNIAASNGLTYEEFLEALNEQGVPLQQFTNDVANQILMSQVRNYILSQDLDISREQVQALAKKMWQEAKKSNKGKALTATEYQVSHILLKLNPLLNDRQAETKLNKIRADIIAKKTTFAQAAKDYSKDYLSGANGGSLGFAPVNNYVPQFAEKVINTKKGVITTPFKTEFGWHILQVTGSRQTEIKEEAFHQRAYETLINQHLQDESKDWIKLLRQKANIRYLVQ